MQKIDLTNQRFGRLLVLRESDSKNRIAWECLCDCGNTVIVTTTGLRNKGTKSCGCLKVETAAKTHTIHGDNSKSGRSRLYRIWSSMRGRCLNPSNDAYANYGGRGITICKEWDEFLIFKEWALQNGYNDTLTIDRIDVNQNYCPQNCRWISRKAQATNKRSNRYITYQDECYTIAEWAELKGMPYSLLYKRLKLGWDVARAIETKSLAKSR